MKVITEKGKEIRGDLLKSVVLRSDLSPVPATLEMEIRVDDDLKKQLGEGSTIIVNDDAYRIVKPSSGMGRFSQGDHDTSMLKIIAMLDACHPITFVRQQAIIKDNATMTEIYRASGATISGVDGDFKSGRFVVMVGEAPVYMIARILQEEGGVVRWKRGKLQFFRNGDLFKQKAAIQIPDNSSENIKSAFLTRHQIPSFYSLDSSGNFVYGNREKARSAMFVPNKNRMQLENMSKVLIRRKVSKMALNETLFAGDLIDIANGSPLVVETVAHVFESNTDNQTGSNQYTKLWLSSLEG